MSTAVIGVGNIGGAVARHLAAGGALLDGKVVIDPSNPIGFDADGQIIRTLPEDQSSGGSPKPCCSTPPTMPRL